MEHKFKVGDKVRRTVPHASFQEGKAYEIKEINDCGYLGFGPGIGTGGTAWFPEFFELVESAPYTSMFQAGDVVYCPVFGKLTVKHIQSDSEYPVRTETDGGRSIAYTADGRYDAYCEPTLSFVPWPAAPANQFVRPYTPRFKKGDLVFVGYLPNRSLREVLEDTKWGVRTRVGETDSYVWKHSEVHPYKPAQ